MDKNPKQLVVEKIKSSSNILVTVSDHPNVDELSSAIGLSLMLTALDKHATAVFSGKVPKELEFLKPDKTLEDNTLSLRDFIISLDKDKADKLRYKVEDDVVRIFITPYRTKITKDDLNFEEGDFNVDLVIALGVTDQDHLDNAIKAHGRILHDATVATINAGDVSSTLGTIDWHDPEASCLSAMLVSISEALKGGLLDKQMSTALLSGIVYATDRFSNDRTTPKIMTMAAQLMAAGADQQLISSHLGKNTQHKQVLNALKNSSKEELHDTADGGKELNLHHEDGEAADTSEKEVDFSKDHQKEQAEKKKKDSRDVSFEQLSEKEDEELDDELDAEDEKPKKPRPRPKNPRSPQVRPAGGRPPVSGRPPMPRPPQGQSMPFGPGQLSRPPMSRQPQQPPQFSAGRPPAPGGQPALPPIRQPQFNQPVAPAQPMQPMQGGVQLPAPPMPSIPPPPAAPGMGPGMQPPIPPQQQRTAIPPAPQGPPVLQPQQRTPLPPLQPPAPVGPTAGPPLPPIAGAPQSQAPIQPPAPPNVKSKPQPLHPLPPPQITLDPVDSGPAPELGTPPPPPMNPLMQDQTQGPVMGPPPPPPSGNPPQTMPLPQEDDARSIPPLPTPPVGGVPHTTPAKESLIINPQPEEPKNEPLPSPSKHKASPITNDTPMMAQNADTQMSSDQLAQKFKNNAESAVKTRPTFGGSLNSVGEQDLRTNLASFESAKQHAKSSNLQINEVDSSDAVPHSNAPTVSADSPPPPSAPQIKDVKSSASGPVIDVGDARAEVEAALGSIEFDPGNNPIEAINAQPLEEQTPQISIDHNGNIGQANVNSAPAPVGGDTFVLPSS